MSGSKFFMPKNLKNGGAAWEGQSAAPFIVPVERRNNDPSFLGVKGAFIIMGIFPANDSALGYLTPWQNRQNG